MKSVQLVRTGRQVQFTDLNIGQAFFYIDAFWTRTDIYTGTDLRRRTRGAGLDTTPHNSYGSCSFGRSEETMVVEEVELRFE